LLVERACKQALVAYVLLRYYLVQKLGHYTVGMEINFRALDFCCQH
jgi:hypothetical protein